MAQALSEHALDQDPQPLPLRTQIYLHEQLLGALTALISYTILNAIGVIVVLLNLVTIVVSLLTISCNFLYQMARKNGSSHVSAFFITTLSLFFLLPVVALFIGILALGIALALPFTPLLALYQGYQKGIKGVFQESTQQINNLYNAFSFYSFLSMVYQLSQRVIQADNPFNDRPTQEKALEIIVYLNELIAPQSLPMMVKLRLQLFEDVLSSHIILQDLPRESMNSTDTMILGQASKALAFCLDLQMEIFNAHGNHSENRTTEVSNDLETFIRQQRRYITEFHEILAAQPLDTIALSTWANCVLAQSAEAPRHLSQQAKSIWLAAYTKTHPTYSPQVRAQGLRERLSQLMNQEAIQVLIGQIGSIASPQPSQTMATDYFDNTFALSPAELKKIRHTRLSKSDRQSCASSSNEKVKELFQCYRKIEDNLQQDCVIQADKPEAKNKIVLLKQYDNNQTTQNRAAEEWLAVRHCVGNTIFDRDGLKAWCDRNAQHPLDRDPLIPPHCKPHHVKITAENGQKTTSQYRTRYRYHPYYQAPENPDENKIYSQTLQSIAMELSGLGVVPDFSRELRAEDLKNRTNAVSPVVIPSQTPAVASKSQPNPADAERNEEIRMQRVIHLSRTDAQAETSGEERKENEEELLQSQSQKISGTWMRFHQDQVERGNNAFTPGLSSNSTLKK